MLATCHRAPDCVSEATPTELDWPKAAQCGEDDESRSSHYSGVSDRSLKRQGSIDPDMESSSQPSPLCCFSCGKPSGLLLSPSVVVWFFLSADFFSSYEMTQKWFIRFLLGEELVFRI